MNKIYGRNSVIKRIWKTLKIASILFTAERRMGKTTVLDELKIHPHKDFLVISSDLEKIDSPLNFVNDVLNKTAPYLTKKEKTKGWFFELWKAFEGTEVGGVIKIPVYREKEWKDLLIMSINAICNNSSKTVVFLWDELPYMLQKINANEANSTTYSSSLQIMDVLRSLRQEQSNLRMVFTGSIGLHHVLNNMTVAQVSSQPVNDMEKIELGVLSEESALDMIKDHLDEEGLLEDISQSVMQSIAQHCDYIPFYIKKLINSLSISEEIITQNVLDKKIMSILTEADEWELDHFRSRLEDYYYGEVTDTQKRLIKKASLAKSILNHCAVAIAPQSIDDCFNALKAEYQFDDRDLVIKLLNNLIKDHYLKRDTNGNYRFNLSILKRWWILAEGLNMGELK